MNRKELHNKILEYIAEEEYKNKKKKNEYLEVGENKKAEKYEDKEYMFQVMYNLVRYAICDIEKGKENV